MVRVALVDPATWSVAYDLPLAEALADQGCEVTLHCARSPHVGLPRSDHPRVRVEESFYWRRLRPLPRRVARALRHPADLAKLIRRLETATDIVHVQWMPMRRLDARAWAQLAQRVPVTFTAHNAQSRDGALSPELLNGFSAVIAHSDGGAQTLRSAGIDRVWRMNIGAYTQYATSPDPDELPAELRALNASKVAAPLAIFAGLIRDYKGVDVLLKAWPLVLEKLPNAQLVIAGRVVDENQLPPVGAELPHGVTLIRRFLSEEELGWLLRRADLCVLPYKQIDMSGIAVSALACHTPLLLSDVGGFGEYVGRGAQLVEPNNVEALAQKLTDILSDSNLRESLSLEAERAVKEHYSWAGIAQNYLEQYKTLGLRT